VKLVIVSALCLVWLSSGAFAAGSGATQAGDSSVYYASLQHTLETAQPEQAFSWANQQNGHSGAIRAGAFFQNANGQYCRPFAQSTMAGGQNTQGQGIACRSANDGAWQIVKFSGTATRQAGTSAHTIPVSQYIAKCQANNSDARIAGCTALIKSGKATKANLHVAYFKRGRAYGNKQLFTKAIADFSKAIALKSTDAKAYYYRGKAKEAAGDSSGGEADEAEAKSLGFHGG